MKIYLNLILLYFMFSCSSPQEFTESKIDRPLNFSGVYPHLAYYNQESECGTGAVVHWADRLWVITYGPHLPYGSSDKLYEITQDLKKTTRDESIGGTPANRMIHNESNQLFIGPYAIDAQRNVRTIPYSEAPGRYTGVARHLTDPKNKIYIATMEEGLYEVDVHSLQTVTLYEDANVKPELEAGLSINPPGSLLPGAHGKGSYSGQGVVVYSNNGEATEEALRQFDIEAGVLAEWNGDDWKVIRRNQFVEVTGPGGIYGNKNPETDPIWVTGWDHKSIIVGVRENDWTFYRLPKASHSYDGAHGWNTEWPRIRNVGTEDQPDYLMTMHGMFWKFPENFRSTNSAGIRPRSAYLKVIGDFTRWNDQLVFGCDDSAQKEFLNKRKVKGNIEGPGQSNSNLWFTSTTLPDELGPGTASGAVWLNEKIKAGEVSEAFLFSGWPNRSAWIKNDGKQVVKFTFEIDEKGNGSWQEFKTLNIEPGKAAHLEFLQDEKGEWIRVIADQPTVATVNFNFTDDDQRSNASDEIFNGLSKVSQTRSQTGLLYGLGDERRALGLSVSEHDGIKPSQVGYYELDGEMNLIPKNDPQTLQFINEKFAIPENVITIEESSVLVVDDKERRWRLPLGDTAFSTLTNSGSLRIAREVATERDLLNAHGTFYELPAENADGFAKVRPIASHNFRINDFASYRGLLIMTGIDPEEGKNNPHIIQSEDGKASVWAGVIDDLWKMGKPTGWGGPWYNTLIKASVPSDPYLFGFYDKRSLTINHDSKEPVTFTIQLEPIGHGPWMNYKEVKVMPGEDFNFSFPEAVQARWIRFVTDKPARATTLLKYE